MMNHSARLAVVVGCSMLCGAGFVHAKWQRKKSEVAAHCAISKAHPLEGCFYAASDVPVQPSLREIQSIVRCDPVLKSHPGRIEFGSVDVEQGAVMAEVIFLEADKGTEAVLCKLVPRSNTWRVASTKRLWCVPSSHLLRDLRA